MEINLGWSPRPIDFVNSLFTNSHKKKSENSFQHPTQPLPPDNTYAVFQPYVIRIFCCVTEIHSFLRSAKPFRAHRICARAALQQRRKSFLSNKIVMDNGSPFIGNEFLIVTCASVRRHRAAAQ